MPVPLWDDVRFMVDTGSGLVEMATGGASDVMGTVDYRASLPPGFKNRVARPVRLNLKLDSSGEKYNPDHASALSGFVVGADCRFDVLYDSAWITQFRGIIDTIYPMAGESNEQTSSIRCLDYMDVVKHATVGPEVLVTSVTADTVINTLDNSLTPSPIATSYATGQSTFDYVGFLNDETVAKAFAKLTNSEGYPSAVYVKRDGTLVFEDRHTRRISNTSDFTLSGTMTKLKVVHSRPNVLTRIEITYHPAVVGGAPEILGEVTSNPITAPGQSRDIVVRYRDKDDKAVRTILGLDVVTVAADTDYTFHSSSDITHTRMNNFVTVVHTKGANSSNINVTNNHAAFDAFATKLEVRATAIRKYENVDAVASNASPATGDVTLKLDMPFTDEDLDFEHPDNLANWLLNTWGTQVGQIDSMTVTSGSDARTLMILTATIRDRVTLTATQTGLATDDFHINSIKMKLRQGGYSEATFGLERADAIPGWLLGTAGRGELGTNTYLG